MKYLLSLLFLLIQLSVKSQFIQQWQHDQYALMWANTQPFDLVTDSTGNVYVCGRIDSVFNTPNVRDGFVEKIDPYGNLLWAASYDTLLLYGEFHNIAVDASGNVYVTGYQNLPPSTSNAQAVTVSYDPSGNRRWVRYYNGPFMTGANGQFIRCDLQGNIIVEGIASGSVSMSGYMYFMSYDNLGNLNWTTVSPNVHPVPGVTLGMELDALGNIYGGCTTNFYGTYTMKLNPVSGTVVWSVGWNVDIQARGFYADKLGNTYFAGTDSATQIARMVSFDSNGNYRWSPFYQAPIGNRSDFFSVAADSSGNSYCVGRDAPYVYSRGLVASFDANGQQRWQCVMPDSGSMFEFLAVSPGGYIATCGYANGIIGLVAKFDPLGNIEGRDTMLSVNATYSRGYATAISKNGHTVYVTESETFPNQVTGAPHQSIATRKYLQDIIDATPEISSNPLILFPNPSDGTFNINFPTGNSSCLLTITDLSGKIVWQGEINNVTVNTNLSAGCYLVRARFLSGDEEIGKLIIQ